MIVICISYNRKIFLFHPPPCLTAILFLYFVFSFLLFSVSLRQAYILVHNKKMLAILSILHILPPHPPPLSPTGIGALNKSNFFHEIHKKMVAKGGNPPFHNFGICGGRGLLNQLYKFS